jgi:flagellar biogenesis protein FliO
MEPTTPSPETSNTKADSGIGAIVGSIIVVLIIILGAFYLFTAVQERRSGASDMNTQEMNAMNNEPATTAELEAELESISTDDLDAELADIEASF